MSPEPSPSLGHQPAGSFPFGFFDLSANGEIVDIGGPAAVSSLIFSDGFEDNTTDA